MSEGDDLEIERARSCDIFVGYCGSGEPLLMRFMKWFHAEMVMNGLLCFVSDRARCSDARDHEIARTAMHEATLGVVIVTRKSFSSPWNVEELKVLLGRKNLIPIFFGLAQGECLSRDIMERKREIWGKYGGALWEKYGGLEGEWRETVDGLSQLDVKLEVNVKNMRDCILDAITLMGRRLGRRDVVEKLAKWKDKVSKEEFPLIRNSNFIGRKCELLDIKFMLFGDCELEGDNDFINLIPEKSYRSRDKLHQKKKRGKEKEPRVWKESNEEIEMEYEHNTDHIGRYLISKQETRSARKRRARDLALGKGIACILGESGIGKTELLLEFAYRHSQMYKMILWVSGEIRYLRVNYMNLLPHLGIDASIGEFCSEKNDRKFEEIEFEAIRKVRKELMRGIPYLLVIDNLECEKDCWDGRKIVELLPRFGGETHIIISSRLPKIMNIQPLRLSNLCSNEAMSLMMGHLKDIKVVEHDALKIIEERLGKLPFGLELVGAILSDNCIDPSKLLEAINRMPYREMQWSDKECAIFRHNPFLVQILDFLFLVFIRQKKYGNLAVKMMQVSGLFGTSPIPVSILALATHEALKKRNTINFWKKCLQMITCGLTTPHTDLLKAEAASHVLIRFHLAKCSPREGFISFHDITRVYAHKRGGDRFASAMVKAVGIQGCLPQHFNHILSACFLLFKLSCSPVVVTLAVSDLLSFIQKFVLPLANHSFTSLSLCNLVLDLLRHSTEELETVENFILADANNGEVMSCFTRSTRNSIIFTNPLLYQDLAHLRATLLEIRAQFMLQCGEYEIGEQFCRTSLNIKEVIYGWEHPETQSTREIMERFISLQSSSSVV